jgi:hypothetical protein
MKFSSEETVMLTRAGFILAFLIALAAVCFPPSAKASTFANKLTATSLATP